MHSSGRVSWPRSLDGDELGASDGTENDFTVTNELVGPRELAEVVIDHAGPYDLGFLLEVAKEVLADLWHFIVYSHAACLIKCMPIFVLLFDSVLDLALEAKEVLAG